MNGCKVAECPGPHFGRGFCRPHYMRWYRTGDPLPKPQPTAEQVFWSRVTKTPGACWVYDGPALGTSGHRKITVNGLSMGAHRFSLILHKGPISDGLCALHHCDNPPCVNPDHLYVGTDADNKRDMVERGRSANQNTTKVHCKSRHEFTRDNTFVRANGHRLCRECHRRRARAARLAKRTFQAERHPASSAPAR